MFSSYMPEKKKKIEGRLFFLFACTCSPNKRLFIAFQFETRKTERGIAEHPIFISRIACPIYVLVVRYGNKSCLRQLS